MHCSLLSTALDRHVSSDWKSFKSPLFPRNALRWNESKVFYFENNYRCIGSCKAVVEDPCTFHSVSPNGPSYMIITWCQTGIRHWHDVCVEFMFYLMCRLVTISAIKTQNYSITKISLPSAFYSYIEPPPPSWLTFGNYESISCL